jgi:hypothetical protein
MIEAMRETGESDLSRNGKGGAAAGEAEPLPHGDRLNPEYATGRARNPFQRGHSGKSGGQTAIYRVYCSQNADFQRSLS